MTMDDRSLYSLGRRTLQFMRNDRRPLTSFAKTMDEKTLSSLVLRSFPASLVHHPSSFALHRSFPEYDWLKLLLHTGKSGTMFPWMHCSSPSQLTLDGSLTMQRLISPFGPDCTQ
jgi:hypothetical protein